MKIKLIYTDGGCIGTNPSSIGGTYAFVHIDCDDFTIHTQKGIITPKEAKLQKISNNYAELYAAVLALESVPEGWNGTLYTDSLVTLRRITNGNKFNGIPDPLIERTLRLRHKRRYAVVLLSGHPTRKELAVGKSRRGYPVSKHNVLCDKMCKLAALAYLDKEN